MVTALVDLAAQTNLTLQWISAHCGIQAIEQADRFAREGGQLDQEDRYTSYTDEKTIIKILSEKKWKQKHPSSNQSDSLHKLNSWLVAKRPSNILVYLREGKLNRPEQVILFRLRTGHSRFNAHMYSKFTVGESEMCPCNTYIISAEHLLQHCQLHEALNWDMWPELAPLRDKLYGNLEEMGRTAAFMRATGISI